MRYINEYGFENFNSKLFKKMAFFLIYSDYIGNRENLAKIGYRLDKLINDPHWLIKKEVAKHGYGLDILVNDPNWVVRGEVARHCYGLDKLINDSNQFVRETACLYYNSMPSINRFSKFITKLIYKINKFMDRILWR